MASKAASLSQWKKSLPNSSPDSAQNNNLVGARVMDLQCLSQGIEEVSKHTAACHGNCLVTRESQREGLASILEVVCDKCEKSFHIESSPKITGTAEIKKRYSVDVGAVWGQMSSGGGQRALNEVMSTINVPGISFLKIENQIGAAWEKILAEEQVKRKKNWHRKEMTWLMVTQQ